MTADERRRLKLLVDNTLREHGVAETNDTPPTKRGFGTGAGRKALLTELEIQSAYRMAQVVPLAHVARLLWKHYGFVSADGCYTALRRAFKARDLTVPDGRERKAA